MILIRILCHMLVSNKCETIKIRWMLQIGDSAKVDFRFGYCFYSDNIIVFIIGTTILIIACPSVQITARSLIGALNSREIGYNKNKVYFSLFVHISLKLHSVAVIFISLSSSSLHFQLKQ